MLGNHGCVSKVDDNGTVFINWDCGLTLGCSCQFQFFRNE
ncbi:MAG: DUF4314 domain-containing protein [Oscillospiraceae bacterium]|nr:DUF4314 domain-containing protein [Oscillospiraceae bacterium]